MPNEATLDEIERANQLEREQQAVRVQQATAAAAQKSKASSGDADPISKTIERFWPLPWLKPKFPVLVWLIVFISKISNTVVVIAGMLSLPVSWSIVAWASFISTGGGKAQGLPLKIPAAKALELAIATILGVITLLLPIVIILILICNTHAGILIKIGAALGHAKAKAINEICQ